MPDPVIQSIIHGIVMIVGVALGFFLSRISFNTGLNKAFNRTIDLLKMQEFIKAGIEFREAFIDTIERLDTKKISQDFGGQNFAMEIVESAYSTQRKAYFKFREFLPTTEQEIFKAAWETYICKKTDDNNDEDLFLDYHNPKYAETLIEIEIEKRKLALDRINQLLEFTNIKTT